MVGCHHQFNGHEFEQALGDGKGQGSLACCSPWGCKELDATEGLNNNNNHNWGFKKEKKNPHNLIYIVISFMVCLPPSLIFDIPRGRKYIATFYIALLPSMVL